MAAMPSAKLPAIPRAGFADVAAAHQSAAAAAAGDALTQASRALWLATLSLMTAFLQNTAPAHRHLLARRIARNLATLAEQECFDSAARASFGRLASRWRTRSEQFAPHHQEQPTGWFRSLVRLITE